MDKTKLYICLEAKHNNGGGGGGGQQQKHKYLICSLALDHLTSTLSDSPTLTTEASFEAYPSMGCGFYQSKIVFAGGQVEETDIPDEDYLFVPKNHHDGLVTFDMISKQLSSDSFPSMLRGKVKPIVFQLHNKLYVADTVSGYRFGSFEYFYPPTGEWNLLHQPCHKDFLLDLGGRRDQNYPCFVFGNTFFLVVSINDKSIIFMHHPNLTYKAWFQSRILRPGHPGHPFPFSGVATFYHHDDDFFIISFTNRVVQIHLFDLRRNSLQTSKQLFSLPSSSESGGDQHVSGYFADFGDGIFSLTASDSVRIYVCTFKICEPMAFELLSQYEYRFDALSFGVDIISVVGCFAPYQNSSAIEHAEKALKVEYRKFAQKSEEDPDNFIFCGQKIEVPEGSENHLVDVFINTPEPMRIFCCVAESE